MFYTSRNVSVKVNNSGIFVSRAALDTSTSITPNYRIDRSIASESSVASPMGGGLALTYYLTGEDPLKACLRQRDMNLSGNFAGLYFNSGRLTRYSFDLAPYGVIEVNAEIEFYEKVKGSYVPSPSTVPKEKLLSVGDVDFASTTSIKNEKILNLSYNYTSEVTPRHVVGETDAVSYAVGERAVTFNCATNDLSIDVPLTGKREAGAIHLKDSDDNIKETFHINGIMSSQDINVQGGAGGVVSKEITIQQSHLGLGPVITSPEFSPSSGPVGTTVTVNGSYFSNTDKVFLFDIPAAFTVASDTSLTFKVPTEPSGMSGAIKVITDGGEAMSTGAFIVS